MATEEVNKPPSLPPYSEMIFAAIDASEEKNGLNKSAISAYIESTYGALPESHSAILGDNLSQLKEKGELVLLKNNYLRPNPSTTTPAKRGRGRPPKPKSAAALAAAAAAEAYVGPPRSRGRPPKQKDPLAVTAPPLKVSSGKPRGRPSKKGPVAADDDDDDDATDDTTTTTVVPETGTPRGRGRPPKVKPQLAAVGV